MTAKDKVEKLYKLKQQLFILEMKDRLNHKDMQELDRLRNEIYKIERCDV